MKIKVREIYGKNFIIQGREEVLKLELHSPEKKKRKNNWNKKIRRSWYDKNT